MDVSLIFLTLCLSSACSSNWTDTVKSGLQSFETDIVKIRLESNAQMRNLNSTLQALAHQLMLQQFYAEQRVRSEGDSGLKATRIRYDGFKNYFHESHNGFSIAAIHDHSNHIRTVGMGEFVAVLNGVEFRTRHNDYSLHQPATSSSLYHQTEPVEFPSVPKSVLDKGSDVQGQIDEMREYFKAWRDQNVTHRDYRPHFKSLLCYLEGAWTNSGSNVDEPFSSDRHFIDAKSWQELQDKVRYSEYTGGKSRLENLALLPTAIMGFNNESIPVFAQWNYRILCHPTKELLPTNRLRLVEDLSSRMMSGRTVYEHLGSRAARFQIIDTDPSKVVDQPVIGRTLLDKLMEEIPGKDNYGANITEESFDSTILNEDGTKKNVGFYHKWYKVEAADAMGTSFNRRGFSDANLFVAATTQDKVAGLKLKKCANWKESSCYTIEQKVSYAIPMEIIYLTPLSQWNPYNLAYHKDANIAAANRRYGSCANDNLELNGTDSKYYYITPSAFFSGLPIGRDTADTVRTGDTCVIDAAGVSRKCRATGTNILIPYIEGVGVLRQRYPIMPVHGEGSAVWKELNALRELVMNPETLKRMYWNTQSTIANELEIETGASAKAGILPHTHYVFLTAAEVLNLKAGVTLIKRSTTAEGHDHKFQIRWNNAQQNFYADKCEVGNAWQTACWDLHPRDFQSKKSP